VTKLRVHQPGESISACFASTEDNDITLAALCRRGARGLHLVVDRIAWAQEREMRTGAFCQPVVPGIDPQGQIKAL